MTTPSPFWSRAAKASRSSCSASERDFTQEEFQDIPGLKRRCILDRDEQIAQKHAIVSIYSDETPESVEAARIMCDSTDNEFIE